MAKVLLELSAAVYLASAILAALQLIRPKPRGDSWVRGIFLAAVVAHAVALGGRSVELHACPIASAPDALSLFSALVAVLSLLVSFRPKGEGVPHVATLTAPLVFLMMIAAATFEFPVRSPTSPETPTYPSDLPAGIILHIGLALIADAVFLVAGSVAIVYLVQENRLKRRKARKVPTTLHDLPPLDVMDRVSVVLLKVGFLTLTVALVMGMIFNKQLLGQYWSWNSRNVVHAMVWVLYSVLLYARVVTGWQGKKAATLTLVGVGAILLGFLGFGLAGGHSHGQAALQANVESPQEASP